LKPVTTGTTWDLLAGSCELSHAAEIKVPGNGFCVMKSRQAIGKSQTTKITAPKIGDSNDAPLWRQVSVTVNKPGYNSVTFLAREKGGKWKSLGTADRTTFATDVTTGNLYRTFLHSELFKKKAPLEFIAVLKNSDGNIISSAKIATRSSQSLSSIHHSSTLQALSAWPTLANHFAHSIHRSTVVYMSWWAM
jgi:hypothetical protein